VGEHVNSSTGYNLIYRGNRIILYQLLVLATVVSRVRLFSCGSPHPHRKKKSLARKTIVTATVTKQTFAMPCHCTRIWAMHAHDHDAVHAAAIIVYARLAIALAPSKRLALALNYTVTCGGHRLIKLINRAGLEVD